MPMENMRLRNTLYDVFFEKDLRSFIKETCHA